MVSMSGQGCEPPRSHVKVIVTRGLFAFDTGHHGALAAFTGFDLELRT